MPKLMNISELDTTTTKEYYLLFTSPYCSPCKMIKQQIDKFTQNNKVYTVDIIEDNNNLVNKYDVRQVPTLIHIKDKNNTKYVSFNDILEIIKQ